MNSYVGKGEQSTDKRVDKYIAINNSGCYIDIPSFHVIRENGREDYQLIYVKKGEMFCVNEGESISFGAGSIILYRPHMYQEYYSKTKEVSFFWIHFSGKEAEEMLSFFKEMGYMIGDFGEFEHFCRSYYERHRLTKNFNELFFEGRLISLFASLKERVEKDTLDAKAFDKVKIAIKYINENFQEKKANEELAQMCGISKYHFIKLFKQAASVSPQKYHNMILLEKGKELLKDTSMNITEISQCLGIEDSLYFSRMFKKSTGLSPLKYRKQNL